MALLYLAAADLSSPSEAVMLVQDLTAATCGIFLLAGLWTPLVGTLVGLDEVWIAFLHHPPQQERTWIHIFMSLLAVSIAMLGPGAWSIDARLFGRKRFDIDRARGR